MALMVTDGTERLGFLIHDAARLLRRRFEAKASGLGLSAAQWRLLVWAVKEEGIAQARLAETLEIEPISVSRLIDRMEEGGWIERRVDAADRRVRMIFPTDKAREAFAGVKGLAGEVYERALAGLSPQDRQSLVSGILKLIDNLSNDETSSCQSAKATKSAESAAK